MTELNTAQTTSKPTLRNTIKLSEVQKKGAKEGKKQGSKSSNGKTKPVGKKGLLIEVLQSKAGVTIEKIAKTHKWKRHSARAMISGLRKDGFKIEAKRNKDDVAVYRIVSGPGRKAK